LTTKKDVEAMITGTNDEEGRIGFVAVTRARDLLVIGIPKKTDKDVVDALAQRGFVDWKPGNVAHPV
jgi:hypothetical protein